MLNNKLNGTCFVVWLGEWLWKLWENLNSSDGFVGKCQIFLVLQLYCWSSFTLNLSDFAPREKNWILLVKGTQKLRIEMIVNPSFFKMQNHPVSQLIFHRIFFLANFSQGVWKDYFNIKLRGFKSLLKCPRIFLGVKFGISRKWSTRSLI